MKRTTAGSDSKRRRKSDRRHEPESESSGATARERGSAAALHGAVGNQAVQATGRGDARTRPPRNNGTGNTDALESGAGTLDIQRESATHGSGTASTMATGHDPADGMCARCTRRYRPGKPLDCEECEAALQRSVDTSTDDGSVRRDIEVSQPGDPAE